MLQLQGCACQVRVTGLEQNPAPSPGICPFLSARPCEQQTGHYQHFLEHWDARGIPCAGQMGEGWGAPGSPPASQE